MSPKSKPSPLKSNRIHQRFITTTYFTTCIHNQSSIFLSFSLQFRNPNQTMLLRGILSTPLPSSFRLTAAQIPPNTAISTRNSAAATAVTLSISDKDLESRGFNFRRSISDLNLDHLNVLFVAVGFPKQDTEKVRVALENTDSVLWVEYETTKRPVAFARATGDGVFNAVIWDVMVDPSFQGIGLGKALMERLVTELLGKGITNIALYSEPRVLGFYRPLGFVADPDGIRGMVYSGKPTKKKYM